MNHDICPVFYTIEPLDTIKVRLQVSLANVKVHNLMVDFYFEL